VADRIPYLTGQRPLLSATGVASREFRLWSLLITDRALIVGNGNPEGVIDARIGAEYADLEGTTGAIKYFKQLDNIGGDKTKGWILE